MITSTLTFPGDLFADFDELSRQFERVLAQRSSPTSSIRAVARGTFPSVNIGATPESVQIYAFAPGVDPKSIDVSVDKGLLTIAGERKTELSDLPKGEKRSIYARERPYGAFRRVIALPEEADPTRVDAQYRNGVLSIRIDKREASRPRRIEINEAR
jgi:HSP20 family protein